MMFAAEAVAVQSAPQLPETDPSATKPRQRPVSGSKLNGSKQNEPKQNEPKQNQTQAQEIYRRQ
jgi:hypothetical protein